MLVRANFIDIPKAFDKVWHERLLFKLERIGLSRNILSFLESFLNNRFYRVVLNGSWPEFKFVISTSWCSIGSILGLLLFLICINDFPNCLESTVVLFADDTSLFSTIYDPNMSADKLNKDLKNIQNGHTNGK